MTPATPITVILATDLDAADVARILLAAFLPFESLYTPAGFRATTLTAPEVGARMAEGPTWLASVDGTVAGTVSAVTRAREVHVRSMAVLPTARKKGVGRALLEEATHFALRQEAYRMTLTTTPFLLEAIHLYRNAGFVRLQQPRDLHGTPLFLMVKELPTEHLCNL